MLRKKGQYLNLSIVFRDGSRTDAKSKMERFVLIINGWKPLTIVKKNVYKGLKLRPIFLTLFKMDLLGGAHGWGGAKRPPP